MAPPFGSGLCLTKCAGTAWPTAESTAISPAAGGEHRKDKGVAILDYALGNRPSTGGGRWAAGCAPQRARRQLVPVVAAIRSHEPTATIDEKKSPSGAATS